MTDVSKLRNYTPRAFPTIDGGAGVYVTDELKRLSILLQNIIEVLKDLDSRITALGG